MKGVQSISIRRLPINKRLAIIGGGLLAIALAVVVYVLVNLPVHNAEIVPTNLSSLPDLVITSAYVSMVDSNGRCLPYYGFNVTVVNQGNAPALDVTLAETSTGQEVHIGNLNPLQSISMPFVVKAPNAVYTMIADPQNSIVESNESNNSATFSEATATPVAACLPLQFGDGIPTSISTPMPVQAQPTTIQQVTPEPLPTIISTPQNNSGMDLESPTFVILKSSDINTSNFLKVDDGLEVSDRSDCLPKDCAFSVWKILQQEALAPSSTSSLQIVISLRSFQTLEDAKSSAVKGMENGGQPGYRLLEVPSDILPEQSWAYAHAGWFVVVTTTYGNMEIDVSLSHSTGGIDINESDKAVALLVNLAKMQIDKIIFAKNK